MSEITADFMRRLYRQQKYLASDIEWSRSSPTRYEAEGVVRTIDGKHRLTIRGKYWVKSYSFSLLYRNTLVRLWDCNDHHEGIEDGHKHPYSEDGEYGEAYSVNDVSTSDVNQALIDFLEECSIQHEDAELYELGGLDNYD